MGAMGYTHWFVGVNYAVSFSVDSIFWWHKTNLLMVWRKSLWTKGAYNKVIRTPKSGALQLSSMVQ